MRLGMALSFIVKPLLDPYTPNTGEHLYLLAT